jgi:hypothetical protein
MQLFDQPTTLESLLSRIEALEARVLDKPVRQCTEVPPELRPAWSMWTLHKAGSKGWTAIAKQRQVAKLAELSGLDADLALRMVEDAIERGWTTFYLPKDLPRKTAHKSVSDALKPCETPLERQLGWIRQQRHVGRIDEAEAKRLTAEATERYRRAE